MSSTELVEWAGYWELEPFGELRADYRAAIVASTVANVHVKKGRSAIKVEEFLPKFQAPTAPRSGKKMTPQEWTQKIVMMNKMMGGKDNRENPDG